ncbi:MAG: amidase domain-containing protein [Acidobacteriota bacterium]
MYWLSKSKAPVVRPYDRIGAVQYAHQWAYGRNPKYYDFSDLGGDCTNFASQCLYAGSGVMNYTKEAGWYYISLNDRAPAWTGVDELYRFLTANISRGPFAQETTMEQVQPGDIVQLSFVGHNDFQHTPVIVAVNNPINLQNILIAAHSDDQDYYPLASYKWKQIRFLKIMGVYI